MPNFDGLKFITVDGITDYRPSLLKLPEFQQFKSRVGYFTYIFINMTSVSYRYTKFLGIYDTEKEANDIIQKTIAILENDTEIKIREKKQEIDFLLRDIINEKQE